MLPFFCNTSNTPNSNPNSYQESPNATPLLLPSSRKKIFNKPNLQHLKKPKLSPTPNSPLNPEQNYPPTHSNIIKKSKPLSYIKNTYYTSAKRKQRRYDVTPLECF